MHNKQTNTRSGPFPLLAGEDLPEARCISLTHSGGVAEAELPELGDRVHGVVGEPADEGGTAQIWPLDPARQLRITLKGTCNPGDTLTLADHTTAADKGKVRTVPAVDGTYNGWFVAEEAGVDGQDVLCRPISREVINVST